MEKNRKGKAKMCWKKRVSKIIVGLLIIIVSLIVFDFWMSVSGKRVNYENTGSLPFFIVLIMIYIAAFAMMMLHIAVHELGHVLFGALTGYKFLSYRFLSFGICRKNGKWKAFRMHIPGIAGQALMEPPECKIDGKKPYFWYNAGGVLMNLIVVMISFVVAIRTKNQIVNIVADMSGLMGYVLAVTNGIPYSSKGITDGCNILQFYKHPERLGDAYKQLAVVGSLSRGKIWREFSPEEFETDEIPDNSFSLIPKLYQMNTWYAREQFDKAREVLEEIEPYKEKLNKLHNNIITLEELFQELIGENDPKKVERLYTKQIRKFVKAMKYDASVWRIQMAYEWFHEQDEVATLVCFEQVKKIREQTMCPGDVELELCLAEYIKKRMEQTDVLQFD